MNRNHQICKKNMCNMTRVWLSTIFCESKTSQLMWASIDERKKRSNIVHHLYIKYCSPFVYDRLSSPNFYVWVAIYDVQWLQWPRCFEIHIKLPGRSGRPATEWWSTSPPHAGSDQAGESFLWLTGFWERPYKKSFGTVHNFRKVIVFICFCVEMLVMMKLPCGRVPHLLIVISIIYFSGDSVVRVSLLIHFNPLIQFIPLNPMNDWMKQRKKGWYYNERHSNVWQ